SLQAQVINIDNFDTGDFLGFGGSFYYQQTLNEADVIGGVRTSDLHLPGSDTAPHIEDSVKNGSLNYEPHGSGLTLWVGYGDYNGTAPFEDLHLDLTGKQLMLTLAQLSGAPSGAASPNVTMTLNGS